jgi:hypothetical protein
MKVEEIIEKVHDAVDKSGKTSVVCVLVHPEDYHDLLQGMDYMRYRLPPEPPIFSENGGLPPAGPSSIFEGIAVMTGVGKVEIRENVHINKGSIVVVTK